MAIGNQKHSGLPSKPGYCSPQFGFLTLLCSLIFTDTSRCSSTSRANGTVIFELSNNQWKYDRRHGGKCPSATGPRQLERGVELAVGHIYGSCLPFRPSNSNLTAVMLEMLKRDRSRLQVMRSRISSQLTASETVPLEPGTTYGSENYVVRMGFGTPAKNFILTVDTASDITWIQCKPCIDCYSQVDPIFDPDESSSYKVLECHSSACDQLEAMKYRRPCSSDVGCPYKLRYADGTVTTGVFGHETLRMASDTFPNFSFGCGHTNVGILKGAAGILGLGRRPLSFISQTAAKYQGYFSYCLPEYGKPDAVGSLSFGPSAIPTSNVVFTTLLSNPAAPSFYYVELSGISVGTQRLAIPQQAFQHTENGRGTIVDSGTMISYLVPLAYEALKVAFLKGTSSLRTAPPLYPLDTCYYLPGLERVSLPIITLHFSDSATFELNGVGSLYVVNPDTGYACLAFAVTYDGVNVIGNLLQQRLRVAYDLVNGKVGFSYESCSST